MPSLGRWGNQWNDRYSKNERTNDILNVCVREELERKKCVPNETLQLTLPKLWAWFHAMQYVPRHWKFDQNSFQCWRGW